MLNLCGSIFDYFRDLQCERSISRGLRLLKKDPYASQASIEKLEQAYLDVRIKRVENMIFQLDKMRST